VSLRHLKFQIGLSLPFSFPRRIVYREIPAVIASEALDADSTDISVRGNSFRSGAFPLFSSLDAFAISINSAGESRGNRASALDDAAE